MGFPVYIQRSHSTFHALLPPSPAVAKCIQWGRERKAGAKWVTRRMTIHAKTKLQIRALNANTNANEPNSSSSSSSSNSNQLTYVPQADFYKVEAILRPWRISQVTSGLLKIGIRGVTVSDVKGFGSQGGSLERQAGSEFSEDKFVSKVKMEIVVSKDQVEEVIDAIIDEARTGEIGDGKIFVVPVADVIRVRTGERGFKAERMAGGRAELLAGAEEGTVQSNQQ
ncbi:nitrogen regulatory protein P-II homolog isoform X2 [Cryptomeria japonica]|uniref:nitrogen regulatory protein P-II homolog isoform X2 n=1 Tax=Cryptomeria japonica TaxID=3369 RepID=UPI0027D9F699|nr:nitrogen regulatory protein P-II homolog isoform X2 [Cryptomeria japonica]